MKNYIKGIDGLRGIAVLSVIVYHMNSTYLPGGFAGVDIFFVISGYVISKSLYKSKEDGIKTYILGFYKRRIARILPPLAVTLFVTMLISTLFIPPFDLSYNNGITGLSAFAGIGNIILSKNFNSYFAPYIEFNPFAHTWSLGIEEQFYLLFPIIFYMIIKKSKKMRIGVSIFLFITLLSLLFNILYTLDKNDLKSYYLLESRFWELASGSFLFLLHNKGLTIKNRFLNIGSSVIAILLLVYSLMFSSQEKLLWALIPVTGSLLLISQLKNKSVKLLNYIFESKILVFVGKISFSLYLWHWPVAVLLRWTVGFNTLVSKTIYIFLSFILAIFSYYLVEKKTKNSKRSLKIIISWTLLFISSWFIDNNRHSITLSKTKDYNIWKPKYPRNNIESSKEQYPELEGKRIFVVGDSHTTSYRVMVSEVSQALGVKNFEYAKGGHQVGNLKFPMTAWGDQDYYPELFKRIKSEMKEGDILFLASIRMPEIEKQFDTDIVDNSVIEEEFFSEHRKNFRKEALEELSLLIEEFEHLNIKILIDAPKPVLKVQLYRCSDWFNTNNPIGSPGKEIDIELNLKLRAPIVESINELQRRHPNVYTWDPFFILYENHKLGDKPVFFDGSHLSTHGNRILKPSFKEKLLEIWDIK